MQKNQITKKIKRALQGISGILNHLGLPFKKYGYYIPYPYSPDVSTPAGLYPLKFITRKVEKGLSTYKTLLQSAAAYNNIFEKHAKGTKEDPLAPRFNQDWFCGLDGVLAYTLVRILKPKKIVEVGAGFSTRFLARAAEDEGLNTALYCINPKVLHGADKLATKFFNTTLDKVPPAVFDDLRAGDILFIDASHLLMPGTDLEILILSIIPALQSGVYIHFHDIFLPDNYPDDADWRFWAFNEQSALAALLAGGAYDIVAPAAWLRKHHPKLLKDIKVTLAHRGLESSFWIVKT